MSLSLDSRQRAMLREMGVHVWQTAAPVAEKPPASELTAVQATASSVSLHPRHEFAAAQALAVLPPLEASAAPAASAEPVTASGAQACWRLGPAQTLFADAAQAGSARWLVLAQTAPAALLAPAFEGDAGRLLGNMLHAARLHQSAGAVVFAPLVRQAISGSIDEFSAALSALMDQARPDIVLVMGRLAGQALLASSEPFGKLRGRPHALHGRATVVTYDAPYLLRCPLDKARAWDDLCLAATTAAVLMSSKKL